MGHITYFKFQGNPKHVTPVWLTCSDVKSVMYFNKYSHGIKISKFNTELFAQTFYNYANNPKCKIIRLREIRIEYGTSCHVMWRKVEQLLSTSLTNPINTSVY